MTSNWVEIVRLVLLLFLLKIAFSGSFIDNFILFNCIDIIAAVVSFTYGSLMGVLHRIITGTDNLLWLSGEHLTEKGLLLSLLQLTIIFCFCMRYIPLIRRNITQCGRKIKFFFCCIFFYLEAGGIYLSLKLKGQGDLDIYSAAIYFFMVIICICFSAGSYLVLKDMEKNKTEKDILETKIKEQYLQYELALELQNNIREMKHDLTNYLLVGGEAYKKEALQYCDKVMKELEDW